MIDSRKVKHAPKEAYRTHARPRHSHALRPRLSNQKAVEHKITLRCVEVEVADCTCSTAEKQFILTGIVSGAVPLGKKDIR